MLKKYQIWIDENVPADCKNMCTQYACEMADVFPELKPVSGRFFDCNEAFHEHWWCITEDGDVVDPTREQFIDGDCHYEIINEKRPECFDKCANCGIIFDIEEVNGRTTVCSDECHRAYLKYINSVRI